MYEIKEKRRNWKINISLVVAAMLLLPGSSMLIDNNMPTGEDISGVSIDGGTFAGTTIYVDDDNTAGPWNGTIDYPYQYIQDGIDNATSGDTIIVMPGNYNEDLNIDKANLTIRSESGKDITTIKLTGVVKYGIELNAGAINTTIGGEDGHGFTIMGPDTAPAGSFLISVNNAPSEVEISYNTINSTGIASMGISIGAAGTDNLTITHNDFITDSGDGAIWLPHVKDFEVSWNTFTGAGKTNSGYQIETVDIQNAIIHNNTIEEGGMSIAILTSAGGGTYGNTNNVFICDNAINDSKYGIIIYDLDTNGNVANLVANHNTFTYGTYGIRIVGDGDQLDEDTIDINYNNIYGNTNGFDNPAAEINATNNYWGDESGPYHPITNPNGLGDNISDNVDFIPWFDAEGNPTSSLPEISDVYATPASQIAGGYVNITCAVVDDLAVDTVKVNITGPDGYTPVNATMNEGITYYYNSIYSTVGTYHYFIWANDTTGMTNTSIVYVFDITEVPDIESPEIANVTASPTPQIADRFVNITCTVTDNRRISTINVNVTYPDASIVNQTMTYNETTNIAFLNSTYSLCGTYSYFIWANDTSGNTNVSLEYAFEIINHPPYKPSDPYPVDQAIEVDINADLSWTGGDPDGHPVTYDIYFDTLYPPAKVISNHSDTTYDPGPMDHSRRYYWKIVAWDNHGASTEGDIWKFTTSLPNRPPYVPYDPIPKNHATNISINTSLKWSGGDPDPNDIVTYDVYLGTTTPPPLVAVDVNRTTYEPETLAYNRVQYWRIVAWDNHGASTESSIWDFTTMHSPNMPPDKPINPIPPDNATNVELNPLLSVYVTDPQSNPMDVSFYDASDNSLIGADNNVASGGRATFPWYGLDFNTTYYWYAVADDGEYANQSVTWRFTTTIYNRPPDTPATPSGPTLIRTGVEYTYTSRTIDPDGNRIFYNFSWGDETCSGWIGPFNSSENVSVSHTWTEVREYEVKVKAKDTYGEESKWSYPLLVLGTKAIAINNLQIGHVYLFNFGYAYLYPLAYLGAVVVITRRADLYINVTATIDVEKVKFIATDIIFGGQTILWDNNTMDGCCCYFNISGGMYNITVYAYDEEGKEVGNDSIRSLFFINFRRFPTKST